MQAASLPYLSSLSSHVSPDSVDVIGPIPQALHRSSYRRQCPGASALSPGLADRKSTRLNSSHMSISYAVFCLKKKIVLVHDAVDPERPDRRAAQRREQQPAQRIAQRVAIAPLQWLEPELGGIRVVLALGHFDQVRPDQPRQIKSGNHLE